MVRLPSGGTAAGRKVGQKIKTADKKTLSSQAWIKRQLSDEWSDRARAEGWRSRAAFKLMEIDDKFRLSKRGSRVIDLGAAPGGWCQVVRRRQSKATTVAIDVLAMDPLTGVTIFQQDITAAGTPAMLRDALGGPADLVLSDMAANTVGHQQTEHLRTMALVEIGLDFAEEGLAPGGAFVAKVLAGGADSSLVTRLKQGFATVKHAKPPASRKESSEWYVVAQGFKGRSEGD